MPLLRDSIERWIGLGPRDTPRRFTVGQRVPVAAHPILSTPGARVCITRDGHDGTLARVLLACVRNGVPVELRTGANALTLDGRSVTPQALRRAIFGRHRLR